MFGDWNSPEAILQAAQYATQKREEYIAHGRSPIFETVLSAPDKISFIKRAKQQGYFIRLFFIGTDSPQINTMRILCRVMDGGHDVPVWKILSRYYKSICNCALVASTVDRLYVYDNSVENSFPELLFRANESILIKQYADIHAWANTIFQAIRNS
jgi:predicted ABC-type ATPase